MPAFQNREVAQDNVVPVLKRDCLIPGARRFCARSIFIGGSPTQPLPPDQARSKDSEVVDTFAPDQAVVPMVMPVVLIAFPWLFELCWIIAASCSVERRTRRQNGGALLEVECNVALQPNGVAGIDA